jgi:hypothetical protein
MSLHYFNVQEAKNDGFFMNANVHTIVENGILKALAITKSILNAPSTSDGQSWFVMSTESFTCWYEVPHPHTKYACCHCERDQLRATFANIKLQSSCTPLPFQLLPSWSIVDHIMVLNMGD